MPIDPMHGLFARAISTVYMVMVYVGTVLVVYSFVYMYLYLN